MGDLNAMEGINTNEDSSTERMVRMHQTDHSKHCPHNPSKIKELCREEYFNMRKGLIDWNKLLVISVPFIISFFIYMSALNSRIIILEYGQDQQRADFDRLREDIVKEVRIAIREENNNGN